MSLGDIIYRILISPLQTFFEVIFVIANRHVNNPAFAIIILSLAMNTLVLPLYRRADAVQSAVRDKEKAIAPWVKHIKKTFVGDERFMMLQAYYRECKYKPTDSLKGSISLLLEIPFFIAAYRFLSDLEIIRGVSFGPITDLGSPDALIHIGTVTLNLLPILMTMINVISAAIYLKGFPLKSKLQMYGVAGIFLVFLYKSPAGLVFYWTLNNLFSLMKNIFYKLPNPHKVLKTLLLIVDIAALIFVLLIHPMHSTRAQTIIVCSLLCLLILLFTKNKSVRMNSIDEKDASKVFYASAFFMTILTGILIPSSIINDSTEEFISLTNYYSPFWFLVSTFSLAFGFFLVWFSIFYRLASADGKKVFSLIMLACACVATMNYMFYGKSYGNISSTLVYDVEPKIGLKSMLTNIGAIIVLCAFILLIFIKKITMAEVVSISMCIAILIMSGTNIISIRKSLSDSKSVITTAIKSEPEIHLSKNGKNVIVIMMDRQIGHYIPFIMNEKPELKESFYGFVNYNNSFSYGNCTNVGSPGLYGGYDYIPSEMNKRSQEKLVDKHNEAIKVMPKLFLNAGFDVTVLDPTYAGYKWIPDLSVYEDLPEIKTGITNGRYSLPELSYVSDDESLKTLRERSFYAYSIFKISPLFIQPTLYANGTYNTSKIETYSLQEILTPTKSTGMNGDFLRSYAVLTKLPELTVINEGKTNTFLMMSNDLTHAPMLLQEPEFKPAQTVDNTAVERKHYYKRKDAEGNTLLTETTYQLTHYQTNVAAMIKLGEWLDYLKEQGIYDNTRIIIVSDHGRDVNDNIGPQIKLNDNNVLDSSFFDSALMVKDFNSKSFDDSNELISNADTPFFATQGLINNPINPFTGNPLSRFKDHQEQPELVYTAIWETDKNNGNVFLPGEWFTVKNNIYEENNWQYLGIK